MKVLIIEASPNKEGLTGACAAAAQRGAEEGGAIAERVRLNDLDIRLCDACGNGWGQCRTEHRCKQDDAFNALHDRVTAADALVLVTPVYWHEPSESFKAFMDRLRRCEASRGEQSLLAGKWALAVAAAGGSGNGTVNCLGIMERALAHMRARPFDLIGITRRSRDYQLDAIGRAARAMVTTPAQ